MFEAMLSLFDDAQLLPHATCLLWRPDLLWLHAVSDGLIALSYYSIPVALLVFAVRRRDLRFRWMFVLFGIFILACGTTHLMSTWTLWVPAWGWSGLIKAVTAVSSVATAALLWPLIPKALALPGEQQWSALNRSLQVEIDDRRAAEAQVRDLNRELEERVRERTAELEAKNAELRQSEERFRLLVDNVRDYAITWLDVDGSIASWNAGAERIYGWTAEEILGGPMEAFYPPEERGKAAEALSMVRESGRFVGEGWRVRKDGSRFWAHVTITPLWDPSGNMRGFVRVARDITERKRVEEALRIAKDEAEKANIAKSKFLASASHDLRQPVQALVLFASVLEAKMGGSPAAAVLGDMKGSLEALNSLLDALLDVSRLDAGIVVPRPTNFSLSVLFERMVGEFAPLAADKKLALRAVSPSVIVRTDPTLLGRVIQNLLANAVRYTAHGRILLGSRRHGDKVRIEVWDSGIGIPDARLKDIFQEFYQVGNAERDRNQGLGLGLAIVQRLSRLLDCPVSVRSSEGRGSVFGVEVPVVGYSQARNVAFLETRPRNGKAAAGVVLVIDDETSVLKGLGMIIEGWGYDVLTATGEAEALTVLDKAPRPPDIIVADYRLREGRTGAEAIMTIRERLGRPVPAILITGDTAPERLREAEAHGLQLLHKPVQPTALQLVIAENVAPSA